jgi:hypothetical protein
MNSVLKRGFATPNGRKKMQSTYAGKYERGSLGVHRLESDELDPKTSIHYDKSWITNANYR